MIRRRDAVLATLGLAALGTAEFLRPRRRLVLLQGAKLEQVIPARFGAWTSQDASLVSPADAGKLARALYSETVARNYFDEASGALVMMLIAYGDTQSDLLQLHRPESCYPAVGFALQETRPAPVQIGKGATIPATRVIATMEGRVENIVYWTRLGERLPQTGSDQRTARLLNAMEGYVADGVLMRFSAVGPSEPAFALLDAFIPQMLRAMRRDQLPAVIGTDLARRAA